MKKNILSCILQAANLPMSIIIVGVGDADFEGNYYLYLFIYMNQQI